MAASAGFFTSATGAFAGGAVAPFVAPLSLLLSMFCIKTDEIYALIMNNTLGTYPALLRIILDSTIGTELAHLVVCLSGSRMRTHIRDRERNDTLAVVLTLFLIHSMRSWYASSTRANAWMSVCKVERVSHRVARLHSQESKSSDSR